MGTTTVSGNIAGANNRILDNVIVNNMGIFNLSTGGGDSLVLNSGTMFNNQLMSGVFDFQSDEDVDSTAGSGTFNNFGTVQKTGGTVTSEFGATGTVLFNNDNASIDVQTGTVSLNDNSSFTGTLTLGTNGLSLVGGTHSFADGSVVAGGVLSLNGGALNALGTLTVDDINLSTGTHTIGTSLLINNTLNWTGAATISGGTLNLPGTTTVSGNVAGANNRILDNVIVNNMGTFNLSTSGFDSLVLNSGTMFNNQLMSGVFDFQSDEDVDSTAGSGTFNNFGTVQKTGGTLISAFGATGTVAFNQNDGTIDVQSGTLALDDGLTWNGGNITGSAGANFTIGGVLTIDGSATKTLSAFILSPATLTVGGTGILDINGGTLNVAGTTTIDNGATLRVSTATFNPAGALNNNGILDLDAGTLSLGGGGTHTGDFDVATGTTLQFSGGIHNLDDNTFLTGTGSYSYTGGSLNIIGTGTGTILDTGSTFSLTGVSLGGPGLFTNQGILNLTNSTINPDFDNQGTLNVSGTSNLDGAVFNLTSGAIALPTGSILNKNGGAFNWIGGSIGSGPGDTGSLVVTGGATFNITGDGARILDGPNISVSNLSLTGGSLDLQAGTFTVTSNTTINPDTTLQLSGGTFNPTGTFDNDGTVDLDAGTLSLSAGGSHTGDFDIATGASLQLTGGTHTFNSGSDTSGIGNVAFTGGTATYNTGTTYSITGDTIINGGDVNFNIAAVTNSLTHVANTLGGSGSLTVNNIWTPTSGVTVNINNLIPLIPGDGGLILGSGINQTLSNIIINGTGTVENQGTLTLDTVTFPNLTNKGILNPGASPGTITISGNFIQGSIGVLNVELGGTAPGDFDLLQIDGTASLGGALNVILCTVALCPVQGNFSPNNGDLFNIISADSVVGDFATFILPVDFTATPSATFYQLAFTPPPLGSPPPPGSPPLLGPPSGGTNSPGNQVTVLQENQEQILAEATYTFPEEDEDDETKLLECR